MGCRQEDGVDGGGGTHLAVARGDVRGGMAELVGGLDVRVGQVREELVCVCVCARAGGGWHACVCVYAREPVRANVSCECGMPTEGHLYCLNTVVLSCKMQRSVIIDCLDLQNKAVRCGRWKTAEKSSLLATVMHAKPAYLHWPPSEFLERQHVHHALHHELASSCLRWLDSRLPHFPRVSLQPRSAQMN